MSDKSTWIERVGKRGLDLKDAPTQLLGDEDVVCAAVKKDYQAFQYASPLLQNDKKFFMEKLIPLSEYSPNALKYASDELQKDKEVVKKAVHYYHGSFRFANSELKDDRDFVKELVQLKKITDWPPAYALQYASKRVQNDKEVVLAAVKNDGGALEYASDELRNDKEVVREAVRDWGGHFQYASEELRNDREFCLECVKISKYAFKYVSEELKKEFGKTKEEFMKKKNEGPEKKVEKKKKVEKITKKKIKKSISESVKNVFGKFGRAAKKKENATSTSVVPEEPKRAMVSNSMETKEIEYQKQIDELKKALSREKKERKAEVDALRVELENREKLTAKSIRTFKNEIKKLKKGNKKVEKEKQKLKNEKEQREIELIESQKKENERFLEKIEDFEKEQRILLFERSLVGKTFKDYQKVKVIGGAGLGNDLSGAMSVVVHVKHKGRDLAMKIMLNYSQMSSLSIGKEFIVSEFLHRLPMHPNILRIHHCFVGNVDRDDIQGWDQFDERLVKRKTAFFIMPLCDANLKTKLKLAGNRRPIFDDKEFISFLKQVVSGLVVMKKHKFIHRDIKFDNFLIKDGKYLICDFGMCLDGRECPGFKIPNLRGNTKGGAPHFMPPEIKNRTDYGLNRFLVFDKYDVYSLGCVCFELFSTRDCYCGAKLKKSECKNQRIRELVEKMLAKYEERFSVEELEEVVTEMMK